MPVKIKPRRYPCACGREVGYTSRSIKRRPKSPHNGLFSPPLFCRFCVFLTVFASFYAVLRAFSFILLGYPPSQNLQRVLRGTLPGLPPPCLLIL